MNTNLRPFSPARGRSLASTPTALARSLTLSSAVLALTLAPWLATASDPAPTVKPRPGVGGAVKGRPDGNVAPKGENPNDRGGTGPRADRKPGDRPEGRELTVFAAGSPESTIQRAFSCVLERSESSGFDCYADLNVASNRDNSNALSHLQRYQWSHFRKWARTYVLPGKAFALLLTRQDPEKVTETVNEVRLYFWSNKRDMPAPITLRRENGRWLIHANSL